MGLINEKRFNDFGELSEGDKKKYADFEQLNIILEGEKITGISDVNDSYVKILFGGEGINNNGDYSNYSEIDWQIKYLMEEKRLTIQNIIDFVLFKYEDKEKREKIINKLLIELIKKIPILQGKKEIQKDLLIGIYKQGKGNIKFVLNGVGGKVLKVTNVYFSTDEGFEENYENMKEQLLSFDAKVKNYYGTMELNIEVERVETKN